MTMTTVAADTAAVSADETSRRGRRSTTTPASVDAELVGRLVAQAREQGLQLSGDGGLLQQLTKRVIEAALDGEITDHLGYENMIRPARTAGIPATAPGPRPCSLMSGRSRSPCRGTGTAASSRRSSVSGSGG